MTPTNNEDIIRHPKAFKQISGMVAAQMQLNLKAYSQEWMQNGALPVYDEKRWDYPLAAAQEVGEFLNSWGYSWWSKADVDTQNCLTELVDAWHFLVSQAILERSGDLAQASEDLLDSYAHVADCGVNMTHREVTLASKTLMALLLTWGSNGPTGNVHDAYDVFFRVLLGAGFNLDHFTARYNAKLQLNIFRQLNGYNTKPRQYRKMWPDGGKLTDPILVEDNYLLAQWIDGLIAAGEELPTDADMMRWIAVEYSARTGRKSVMPHDVDKTGTEE